MTFQGLSLASGQDVPFLESPESVVEAMLELAGVTDTDIVYDLGSGDGRIVIAAAARARVNHKEVCRRYLQGYQHNFICAGTIIRIVARHEYAGTFC